ncbi:hypothetical protein DCS_04519 [Drechmeria coniospora]|uniref:RNase H type-1 domain-containing protein n=1 Tax=Drechmeria coniospora TaxID=98403 RepID=A0A151GK89_DRECN|nr:hypothetical protein DCS_04519 [Drechmeria coniospora]KYK57509.1 hypothetical protein DCS_04519 [Drechmeria coniospora]
MAATLSNPPDFEERLNCLEEEFPKIRSTISLLLKQNQPSQQTALATPSPRTRSQRSGLFTAPDWAVQIKDAFERCSREIADLRRIATASTSGPNDDNPDKSEDNHQTNLNIRTKQPEPKTNGNVAVLHAADEPWSISSEPSSAGDDGDSESSSTHETDDSERIDEGDMTRPKPSQFHLTQGDMGRNLIPNMVPYREDSLFAGKLTADLPRVGWSKVLESLSSITGDGHQLGVRFRARKGFTNLWIAAPPPGSLEAIPVPPDADTEYRQGLETFLDNLIEDPPKTEIPYYVGPVPHYEGMLSAGADLEKLPQMDGVNKHYITFTLRTRTQALHSIAKMAGSAHATLPCTFEEALDWKSRSGASFEADKTAIIHFTRRACKVDPEPFTIKGQLVKPKTQVKVLEVIIDSRLKYKEPIKGQLVKPKTQVKVLEVIIDSRLKYKEHIAIAATKGLEAALELQRLRGLTAATARQLFTAMVAPVVDYASNVWMHACKDRKGNPVQRVQKIGAQAIVGTFLTVATSVAEAEAHIPSAQERFWRRAIKLWTDLHTLPKTNPLRACTSRIQKSRRSFQSPFYPVAMAVNEIPMDELETINPFTLSPWEERTQTRVDVEGDPGSGQPDAGWAVCVAVTSSARNSVVGIGAAIDVPISVRGGPKIERYSFTLGMRTEQSPFSGELAAMAYALKQLPELRHRSVALLTSNKAAVLTIRNPHQQSGQGYVESIYNSISTQRTGA